jgi:small-conductance mechanosensitive channel
MSGVAPELLGTLAIVLAVVGVNFAISWMLRSRAWLTRETKLRASVFWRNTSLLIAALALLFVWRTELRAAALSLAALSVALVLAGKELLTSVLGYIHRTTSGSFRFGDVIEIHGMRGEVIDQTLLTTTVLEMTEDHQFTGRTVQFPNSFYILQPLTNHSTLGPYQLGLLRVPLVAGSEFEAEKQLLERTAASVCHDFVARAEAALRALEGEQFLVLPSAEPRVTLRLEGSGALTLVLRYPCPTEQRTRTEQEILTRYLSASREVNAQRPGSVGGPRNLLEG